MPIPPPVRYRRFMLAGIIAMAAPALFAAEGFTPYEVDPQTLHLWHLDEPGGPFADGGQPATPLRGLLNGALSGQISLPGLSTAISFRANAGGAPGGSNLAGAILAEAPKLIRGNEDNVGGDFRYFGADGAFTYEMAIKLEQLPAEAGVIALGLMSMDGDGDARDRIFNFRIEKQGFLAFIPLSDCGASGLGLASIPVIGKHAMEAGKWYHVAVTYDGHEGVINNLKLYWTRLDSGATEANLIGGGTLSHDLNGVLGDFAIGNEARGFAGNAEAEPFPGLIDEVRISGVARHPSDFFFVPEGKRVGPGSAIGKTNANIAPERLDLKLASILVDASSATMPGRPGEALKLSSGLHRLDFDFGFSPGQTNSEVKLRCKLEGLDERWQETERGMSVVCQALDSDNQVISQSVFSAVGRSGRWESTLNDSALSHRTEPIYLPAEAVALQLSVTSGAPDTTGLLMVDNIKLTIPGEEGKSLWENGSFVARGSPPSAADVPVGWRRDGTEPAIAYLTLRTDGPAISLVDGDQTKYGEWVAVQKLANPGRSSRTLVLSWDEAYNVIGGSLNRATYVNVPPGDYTFKAIGLAGADQRMGEMISLPIQIAPPVWRRPWFAPVVAAGSVGLVAAAAFRHLRRRSKLRLERLRFQNALEQDRSRIARDMHDDLGTRVTVLNMTAALARRDMTRDPAKAERHLEKMTSSARDLVSAMDDLVWAVDPAHDTLDHLALHLTRLADEMFRDSPVRCRLEIPAELPARALGSEFRHHVALSVKESLHNVLQHAGPCEVFLSLSLEDESVAITIRDTGRGFDPKSHPDGHGLGNTAARIREIGGSYALDSSAGHGTSIVLICRLPAHPK